MQLPLCIVVMRVVCSAKELGNDRLTNRRRLLCPSSEEK